MRVAHFYGTPPAERDDADLETILTHVDRAADLVRQFQEISRYHTIPYANGAPMLDLSPPPHQHDHALGHTKE